jgi:hypothetical protein
MLNIPVFYYGKSTISEGSGNPMNRFQPASPVPSSCSDTSMDPAMKRAASLIHSEFLSSLEKDDGRERNSDTEFSRESIAGSPSVE